MSIPRPEHPKPQFQRDEWINLNGYWTYAFDFGRSGMERDFSSSQGFDNKILVPFCPESTLSEVEHTDFIEMMWYQREIRIPNEWAGKRILLHFGGVDYESEVFIDGVSVGRHWGGTVSFFHDISRYVEPGHMHSIVVYVRDDTRSGVQPGGKQRIEYSYREKRCHYTRTTGIWQTVWLEAVDPNALLDCQLIPDIDQGQLACVPRFFSVGPGHRFRVRVLDDGKQIAEGSARAKDGVPLVVEIDNPKLWEPGHGFLYDLELSVLDRDGKELDSVRSYVGMRCVHTEGNQILVNNKPVYLRLVLDQGFYPEGIWTAPNDEALKRDIELAMQAGFNGARLHQKVFEERFHYWADRLGYLTWGESASWGVHVTAEVGARNFLSEWREIIHRDRNHPSIIAWTPLNETRFIEANPRQHNRFHIDLYELTHALDPTRPVNDSSGYIHVRTDLYTVHEYEGNPDTLKQILTPDAQRGVFRKIPEWDKEYEGQPYLVDEFGGIMWIPPDRKRHLDTSWGYGENPENEEDFYKRLEGLVEAIMSHKHICGYCYTQLTDIEQEQNGIYNYDRTPKFDMKRIQDIFARSR